MSMFNFTDQPIGWDHTGKVVRFKQNTVVNCLKRVGMEGHMTGKTLYCPNKIAIDYNHGSYTRDELVQFNQLIGYSVSGFSTLSVVSPELVYEDEDEDQSDIRTSNKQLREYMDGIYELADQVIDRNDLRDLVSNKRNPDQPIVFNKEFNEFQFQENRIVRALYEKTMSAVDIHEEVIRRYEDFEYRDYFQFLQLIGCNEEEFNNQCIYYHSKLTYGGRWHEFKDYQRMFRQAERDHNTVKLHLSFS